MQNRDRNVEGYILIVTMWVTLAISATAVYFANTVILQQHVGAAAASGHQSELAQDGVIEYIRAVLTLTADGTIPEPDEDITCEDVPLGEATFWIVGRSRDEGEDDSTEVVFGLVDECAKINLNTATADMLLPLPGMTAALAAAIIDWRDTDDDVSEGGAEAETYSRLERPYQTKNAPFASVEETRLVYGVTLGNLTGRDRNLNGIVETSEEDPRFDLLGLGETPAQDFGWLDYCTVWSREANQRADGTAKINVNSQDTSGLEQLLSSALDTGTAERVLSSMRGTGRAAYSSVLHFYIASGLTPVQFAGIADDICTTDDAEIRGLVNINTAPKAVLVCLPGIDENLAAQVLAYRLSNSEDLDTVAWVVEVLGQEAALPLGPYITTRSCQCSADIVTVGRNGRGLRRTFVVFDSVSDDVRVLYRRDRAAAGNPFVNRTEETL